MSQSTKKTKRSKSPRSNGELLKELEVTRRLLIEKEEELVLCQEQMAYIVQGKKDLADPLKAVHHKKENGAPEERIEEAPAKRSPLPIPAAIQTPTTVPIKIAPFADIIQENKPFTASISINLTNISAFSPGGLHCKTRLVAKRLTDGWSALVGEKVDFYSGRDILNTHLEGLILPEGLYRLQATASFSSTDGKAVPIAALHEGDLLHVI